MRIFSTFPEAIAEIRRELKEMGHEVKTKTMQDKNIADDPNFATLELQNYIYTVTQPQLSDLSPVQPWADADWIERWAGAMGSPINPGAAYKLRDEVWSEFLHDGKFAYTYSERLSGWNLGRDGELSPVQNVISRLLSDPYSRQLYIPMFEADDTNYFGQNRVPCSLGWHLMYRQGELHMTYFMRSCDFVTHFQNDIWMSRQLQEHIAKEAGLKPGRFCQFMASLHVYKKDVADAF